MASKIHLLLPLIIVMVNYHHTILASRIDFQATPSEIHSSLTRTLSLNCSLSDSQSTASPSGSTLVGRSAPAASSAAAAEQVEHVTSITISNNQSDVIATVTPYTSARPESAAGAAATDVKGDVTGSSGVKGYLQVTWTFPDAGQLGGYQCEIHGLTGAGHHVEFFKSLSVTAEQMSVANIVKELHDLKSLLYDQKAELGDQAELIRNMSGQIVYQNNKIIALETELEISRHAENGIAKCKGNSDTSGWVTEGDFRVSEVMQNFKKPFTTKPLLHISIVKLDRPNGEQDDQETEYYIEARNVTETNFVVACKTIRLNHWQIQDMWVSWLAVAE